MTDSLTATDARPTSPQPSVDVLCVGETMVMLTPDEPVALTADGARLGLHVGGAESNVAMGLAQLGVSTGWWSRLGNDPLGELVRERISAPGVAVAAEVDPGRRTGVYLKYLEGEQSRVLYYRAGSAASAISPADLDALPAWSRVLHLSGITPALSPSADEFVAAAIARPRAEGQLVSFDINYRAPLWPIDVAAPRLAELAADVDILFVGLDEAETLWGDTEPHQLRDRFPNVGEIVVKNGSRAAHLITADAAVAVAPGPATVVEVVGAGDAFAAGYLAARLRGLPPEQRLAAGHRTAREAIAHLGDVPTLPPLDELLATPSAPGNPAATTTGAAGRSPRAGAARRRS